MSCIWIIIFNFSHVFYICIYFFPAAKCNIRIQTQTPYTTLVQQNVLSLCLWNDVTERVVDVVQVKEKVTSFLNYNECM